MLLKYNILGDLMKNITCKTLLNSYNNDYNSVIIDLRSPRDFLRGHIPNSYNIPYEMFITKFAYYLNYNKTYYLICEGGERSKECAILLSKNNYQVINIVDGFKNWKGPITTN